MGSLVALMFMMISLHSSYRYVPQWKHCDEACTELDRRQRGPYFAFVHYFDHIFPTLKGSKMYDLTIKGRWMAVTSSNLSGW